MKKEIITNILGNKGRMICASKGQYRYDNPRNVVLFNANLCTNEDKLWYGDVDITVEADKLKKIASELNEVLYVLREMDGRFENEERPLIDNAIFHVLPTGEICLNADREEYIVFENNRYLYKKEDEKKVELPNHWDGNYSKEDFSNIIEVDDWGIFESSDEDCPLIKFWKFVGKSLGKKLEEIKVCDYVICEDSYNILKSITKIWMEEQHGLKGYQLQKNIAFHMLDIGPNTFSGSKFGPSWCNKDSVYVRIKNEDN